MKYMFFFTVNWNWLFARSLSAHQADEYVGWR